MFSTINVMFIISLSSVFQNLMERQTSPCPILVDSNFIDLDYSLSLLLGQNNCKLFSLPFEVSFPVLFLAQGLLC